MTSKDDEFSAENDGVSAENDKVSAENDGVFAENDEFVRWLFRTRMDLGGLTPLYDPDKNDEFWIRNGEFWVF